ncbi:MAG: dihydroorotase [Pseudomonadota bacterium]
MRVLIQNGRLIDPANQHDAVCDLYIAEGKIVGLGQAPQGFTPDRVIDASGLIVCPGLIDLQAHLREPGQKHKGTIASETAAAVAGGITTLCCPPDTDPVIDSTAVVELIKLRAEQDGQARVVILGALTKGLGGELISSMAKLKAAGCVGFSNAHQPVGNTVVLRRAMEYAATLDMTVFLHAQDPSLSAGGMVHEGAVSTRLGLAGIPACSETLEVARLLQLIGHTGVRAHFSQLSTAKALQLIGRARYDGLPVSADVAAHQLHLTQVDIAEFNSLCHVRPPLRTERDRDGLIEGVGSGALNAICSDHQPHDRDAKLAPFAETEPGISGLETLLPLALRLRTKRVSLMRIIDSLTREPARILGLEVGHLSLGAPADVCIFDPDRYWRLEEANMRSQGRNTPFLGWEFQGRVVYTLVDGRPVFELSGAA